MNSLEYKDVKLIPRKSILRSREDANVAARLGKYTFKVPVVAANMKSILTPEICYQFDRNNWFYIQERVSGVDFVRDFTLYAQDNFNVVSISVGITDEWMELLKRFKAENYRIDFVTIDIAHAHTDFIQPIIEYMHDNFESYIIAGNVSTPDGVQFLEGLGVDCIKVGQGISQSCRTAQFTGFGSTSLGSLIECSRFNYTASLMSDGGLQVVNNEVYIGDIAKAFRFGADWVMSGSLFSRCIDSPAILHGYAGNASAEMKGNRKNVEGAAQKIITNGLTIKEMMDLVEDSLKSAVSYAGGSSLDALSYVDFIDLRKV